MTHPSCGLALVLFGRSKATRESRHGAARLTSTHIQPRSPLDRGRSPLLHRHRFRQVPWLVHVTATTDSDVVREKLHWKDFQNRQQRFRSRRDVDHVVGRFFNFLVAFGRQRDHYAAVLARHGESKNGAAADSGQVRSHGATITTASLRRRTGGGVLLYTQNLLHSLYKM